MQCTACGQDNRDGRRFCGGCGAGLAQACARCGFANLPSERFCGGCGGSLEAAAPAGERRQVAILFADLAGYTRLSTQLDPEELHRLLEGFFEVVDGACTRFGGTIDKHIGDNVMAIFGAPIAHGDDPERAIRASIDIHREVAAYSARVGRELLVHVGIGYGEVIASGSGSSHHRAYTVTGDAVNLAARLQDKAVGGETLISDAVYRAAARVVLAEPVGDVTVKGLAAPVPVWRVTGVRVATAPLRVVGRDRELARIDAALARPGAIVVVRSDPGLGKTAVVAEASRRAAEAGLGVHLGQVLDFGAGRGAGAIAALTASLLGTGDDRGTALDAAVRDGRCTAADAPYLAALLEIDAGLDVDADADERERRERRRLAFRALATSATPRPLIVVEDLHWADAATLDLLLQLAGAGVTMLLTTRIDGDPAIAWPGAVVLDLEPLSAEAAARLAGDQLEDAGLVARCVERAGGNPLFLEQLIAAAAGDAALPGTLQGLVLARVDRLPPRDKAALQAASICGQRVPLAVIRHLSGDRTWAPDELIARRLLRAAGDDGDLVFHHALILDGVYSSLTHARRRELHRAAAAYHAGGDPELRAEHLERAGDPGAASAWHEAAEAQITRHDLDRAIALATRGLACATTPADRHALAAAVGRLHLEAGDGPAAARAWTSALDDAPDEIARCRALVGLAGGHRLTASYVEARRVLDLAEPLAIAHDLGLEQVQIAYYRGSIAFGANDAALCRSEHQRALELSRAIGALDWEPRALSGLGDAYYVVADFEAATAMFAECIAVCEARGLRRYALLNRIMHADSAAMLGELPAAIEVLRRCAAEAVALSARRAEGLAMESLAMLYGMAWRHEEHAAIAAQTRELVRVLGMRAIEMFMLVIEAELQMALGDRARAVVLVAEARTLHRELGTDFLSGAIAGIELIVSDTPEECQAQLVPADQLIRQRGIGTVMYRRVAIETCLRHGLLDDAAREADLLLGEFPTLGYAQLIGRRGKLIVAWRRGDRSPAIRAELAAVRAMAAVQDVRAPLPEDA